MHYYSYSIQSEPYLTYGQVGPGGQLLKTLPLDIPHPTLLHDFAITDTHAVFVVGPLKFDLSQMLLRQDLPFVWHKEQPARVGLLPMSATSGKEMQWCAAALAQPAQPCPCLPALKERAAGACSQGPPCPKLQSHLLAIGLLPQQSAPYPPPPGSSCRPSTWRTRPTRGATPAPTSRTSWATALRPAWWTSTGRATTAPSPRT
jgi:hypothetical protein